LFEALHRGRRNLLADIARWRCGRGYSGASSRRVRWVPHRRSSRRL